MMVVLQLETKSDPTFAFKKVVFKSIPIILSELLTGNLQA